MPKGKVGVELNQRALAVVTGDGKGESYVLIDGLWINLRCPSSQLTREEMERLLEKGTAKVIYEPLG